MRYLLHAVFCFALLAYPARAQAPLDTSLDLNGRYLNTTFDPEAGGVLSRFAAPGSDHDAAAGNGLVQEGFGTPSLYVPNRRLNAAATAHGLGGDVPYIQYEYDCDGPNIRGIRVTRTVHARRDEASVKVTMRLDHRGNAEQWIAPWVRCDVGPGANPESAKFTVPALEGLIQPSEAGYWAAARNWIAVTDPGSRESVCAVFHADHLHSLRVIPAEPGDPVNTLQGAFVPRLFRPGEHWETTYRIHLIRGLERIDFASDELAAQVDYADGTLTVLIALIRDMAPLRIDASVLAGNGRVWRLPAKQFEAGPGRLVRCTYAWDAPAPGAYDFLAQFQMYGAAYNIGDDTGSPHGGLDTQFVVGNPENRALAAWTDAPYALERGPRTLTRDLATSEGPAVWVEPSLTKLFHEDTVQPSGRTNATVSLDLARNEYESFQIAVRPDGDVPLRNIAFEMGDLVASAGAARIPADAVRVHRVAYHAVRVPSHFEGPTGDWPDALPPYAPVTAEPDVTTPVWFTVYAPPGTPAGRYTGTLRMTARDMAPIDFLVVAQVRGFTLPDTPSLQTDFRFDPELALAQCRAQGYRGTREALLDAYLRNALEHRVTLRELVAFPAETPDYAATLRQFAGAVRGLRARGANTFAVPASLAAFPEQLGMANAFVKEQGLDGQVFAELAGEPPPPAWPRLTMRVEEWASRAPDIPAMVKTLGLQPYLDDAAGLWTVHSQLLDTPAAAAIRARLATGAPVWGYVDATPARPYANLFLDFDVLDHRLLFWQFWAAGFTGFHYPGINELPESQNPWVSLLDPTPVNGSRFLVYPSADGPVDSIRWNTVRDGIEDYEYLVILTERLEAARRAGGPAAAIRQAEAALQLGDLIPNIAAFSRDTGAFATRRALIASAIEALPLR